MSALLYVKTVREVRNPSVGKHPVGEERFEPVYIDRFDGAVYDIIDLGVKVRITGKHGSVLVPWTAISYAEEMPEVQPTIETTDTVAASPKAMAKRGGK